MTSTAGPVVYVIDDDELVRRAIGRLLTTEGYRVVLCESAAAFLAIGAISRPTCLIVDVRMPGMTGLDLLEELNTTSRALPLVFITGHGDAGMAARATAAGAVALLLKPADHDELFEAVRRGIAADRARLAAAGGTLDPSFPTT